MSSTQVRFFPNKITQNTVRFQEVGKESEQKVSTVYVKKSTLKELGMDVEGKKDVEDLETFGLLMELSVVRPESE